MLQEELEGVDGKTEVWVCLLDLLPLDVTTKTPGLIIFTTFKASKVFSCVRRSEFRR